MCLRQARPIPTVFAELTNTPVMTNAKARGSISEEHPLCFGGFGAIHPVNRSIPRLVVSGVLRTRPPVRGNLRKQENSVGSRGDAALWLVPWNDDCRPQHTAPDARC